MRRRSCLLILLLSTASALAALPDSFSGEGLTVTFTSKAENDLRGTLELGGQKYPFTARRSGETELAGTFTAGGKAYPFKMAAEGNDAVLETEGTKYRLAADGVAPAPQPGGRRGPAMTFAPQKITDPKTRLDVATVLVPQGWKIEPGVWWRPHHAQFVTLTTAVFDPTSGWAVRWIPHDQFIIDPALYQNAINQGAKPVTVGGIEYAPKAMSAVDYVQMVVLPRYRNVKGLKVVSAQDLPKLAQTVDQTQPQTRRNFNAGGRELVYTAARVRIEYPGPGGGTMDEDIVAVLNISWDPRANAQAAGVGLPPQQFILCDRLYSYTAPHGQLDLASGYLDKIVFSFRPEAEWLKFIDNIQNTVNGIALNEYALIQARNKEITEIQRKTVEESWKTAEKQSDQVGELLGGSQWRNNPHGGPPVRGTAGNNTWVRPNGEQKELPPGEDPNVPPESTKDWKLAKAANTK